MNILLTRLAAFWTAIGLLSGLTYRELTRSQGFEGKTQLAFVHTHTLALGTLMLLILLLLNRAFDLAADRRFRWALWTWNAGLAITATMLAIKGTLQVLGSTAANSKALAGIAGTGHITLSVAFVFLFVVLMARVKATSAEPTA
ncbi:MAG TPA: DUF2871 domain-containing protein [Phycicoccus sp.]|nr:DUF2871 domain-containing protein [Phycicoccus sp.]